MWVNNLQIFQEYFPKNNHLLNYYFQLAEPTFTVEGRDLIVKVVEFAMLVMDHVLVQQLKQDTTVH